MSDWNYKLIDPNDGIETFTTDSTETVGEIITTAPERYESNHENIKCDWCNGETFKIYEEHIDNIGHSHYAKCTNCGKIIYL